MRQVRSGRNTAARATLPTHPIENMIDGTSRIVRLRRGPVGIGLGLSGPYRPTRSSSASATRLIPTRAELLQAARRHATGKTFDETVLARLESLASDVQAPRRPAPVRPVG